MCRLAYNVGKIAKNESYFQIKISIPVKMKAAPVNTFTVNGSFKIMKESKSDTTILALSILTT